ncbi:hypothetical protein EF808_05685 [archaeon]|nr:MAG: hypothetical protein EF808_05685 [archaeon]
MDEIVARWLLLTAIFLGGEILIRTYYLLGPTSGSLVSAVAAHLEFPFWSQWALFFFIAMIFIVLTRELKK